MSFAKKMSKGEIVKAHFLLPLLLASLWKIWKYVFIVFILNSKNICLNLKEV